MTPHQAYYALNKLTVLQQHQHEVARMAAHLGVASIDDEPTTIIRKLEQAAKQCLSLGAKP